MGVIKEEGSRGIEGEERREEMVHGLMRIFHPERRVMLRLEGWGVEKTEKGEWRAMERFVLMHRSETI